LAEADIVTPAGRFVLTTIVIGFDITGFPEMHAIEEFISQVTTSPFTGEYTKTALVALFTLVAFTFHWYTGEVPPFTGFAVKVTGFPEQTGLDDAMMVMPIGNTGLTVMVIGFEIAGFSEVHTSEELTSQLTTSPSTGVYVKTALLALFALTAFTFHWYCGEVPPLTAFAV
jgi:hypothetical protein